ncbi:hypothetical protein [Mariprofundus sp. KV]|uniref:hypothetical protein n=1 Tax=Mariprofundus sp. KV TaxID=2608715 RepID=UPI001F50CE6B|nr:hypothetical protein [Mariprofundus sp. KV]
MLTILLWISAKTQQKTFALFVHALVVRENPGFQIKLGSNAMFYFSIAITIVSLLVTAFVLFVAWDKGRMPVYIGWQLGIVIVMAVVFGWSLIKLGKARRVEKLDELPYGLEQLVNNQ